MAQHYAEQGLAGAPTARHPHLSALWSSRSQLPATPQLLSLRQVPSDPPSRLQGPRAGPAGATQMGRLCDWPASIPTDVGRAVLPRHARYHSLSQLQSLPISPFSRLSRRWGRRERKPPTTALQRPRSTGRCCCIPTGRLPATYQGRHAIDSVTRHDSRLPVVQVSNLWD